MSLSILLGWFMLVGCGSDNKLDDVTMLEGNTWISELCQEMNVVGVEEEVKKIFYKNTYQFGEDNKIYFGVNSYTEKTCTDVLRKNAPLTLDKAFNYYDLGEKSIENGYYKHGIRITLFSGAIKIDDVKNGLSKDAFFAINQNRVCFSKSIFTHGEITTFIDSNGNKITSTIDGFYLDSLADISDEINYEDCLLKE